MFSGKKEYFAWEFNSLPQPSLEEQRGNKLHRSIFQLGGEQEIAWKPLTQNGINTLVLASALRIGVLIEVNKTYMKK